MRMIAATFTVFCLACLSACGTVGGKSDVPVVDGTCVISHNMAAKDSGANVQLGGRTFHVTLPAITWDHNGSLPLTPDWGLLEMQESPNGVIIRLDGVDIGNPVK